jgi:hypothetical protein
MLLHDPCAEAEDVGAANVSERSIEVVTAYTLYIVQ